MGYEKKTKNERLRSRGLSYDDCIFINIDRTEEGVEFEYEWLDKVWGKMGFYWKLIQREVEFRDEKVFEIFTIKIFQKSLRRIHFDITKFYGKGFPEPIQSQMDRMLEELGLENIEEDNRMCVAKLFTRFIITYEATDIENKEEL